MLASIRTQVSSGERISRESAEWLFRHATDDDLSTLATMVRDRFHRRDEATYLLMAIINYTNVCVARCDFCSFYRLPGHEGGYLLDIEQVCERITDLLTLGGTLVAFNGGFDPRLRITDYADLFRRVHARFPDVTFFEMTVAEFMYSCKVSAVTYAEGAKILADTGTQWVTGGGSEILDDAFRKRHSPLKYTVEEFYQAQKAILDAGLGSTATMVIGFDETLDERLNHLERLRTFQDEVDHALPSFLCWTYKPWNNDLGGDEIQPVEYLRWLAICRLYLDNFIHFRTSVLTQNEGALRGLRFGANDFDLPTEDEVTQKAGATISHAFETILATAVDLGLKAEMRPPFATRVSFSPRAA